MGSMYRLQVAASLEHLSDIRDFVRAVGSGAGMDADSLAETLLAVDEAATNIVMHGYSKCSGSIIVEVESTTEALIARLRDAAEPFDPCCVPAPDLDVPLERRRPGGLGIHLMRQFVDEIHHRVIGERGNELTLVKKFRTPLEGLQERGVYGH